MLSSPRKTALWRRSARPGGQLLLFEMLGISRHQCVYDMVGTSVVKAQWGARRTSDSIWVEEETSGLDKESNMMIRSLAHGQQWVNRFTTVDSQ